MLKLIIFTSVFQLTLLIPPEILITTFKKWGLKGEALLTILGAFTVWADIKTRTDKILSARFARGFIEERTFLNKARQLPYVLVPLVIGIIRTAIERADSWEQKNILHLLKNHKVMEPEYPFVFNGFILAGITCWFILAFYSKVIV
jgi:energy-coupling factor transporter transmembrane protein EcfT